MVNETHQYLQHFSTLLGKFSSKNKIYLFQMEFGTETID